MKEVLPLLSVKEYYQDLTYGYARGNEPVQYVTRIRDYDDILQHHFKAQKSPAKEAIPAQQKKAAQPIGNNAYLTR